MAANAPAVAVAGHASTGLLSLATPFVFPAVLLLAWMALSMWLPFAVASPWESVQAMIGGGSSSHCAKR